MKTLSYANDVQEYLFSGKRPDWDGAVELFFSFHLADPGISGSQSTHEATFQGYSRASVPRPGGFSVSEDAVASLAANMAFSMRTSGGEPQTLAFLGIGTSKTGAGKLLHIIKLPRAISVEIDGAPFIAAGELKVTER